MESQAVAVAQYQFEQEPDDAEIMAIASVICNLILKTGNDLVINSIKITRIS